MEVLGNRISYSFNYDQRFQNRLDGLGFKVEGSYFAIDSTSVATFPFGLNYLLGKMESILKWALEALICWHLKELLYSEMDAIVIMKEDLAEI